MQRNGAGDLMLRVGWYRRALVSYARLNMITSFFINTCLLINFYAPKYALTAGMCSTTNLRHRHPDHPDW